MNKKLDETAMRSELSGSAFFGQRQPTRRDTRRDTEQRTDPETAAPRAHDTVTPANEADDLIEVIRRAVKPFGKEDATYRFTAEEKKALADVVYTYGAAGIRTSQNEITRIGINSLIEDYRRSGESSILARVLARLND